jgi:flagellar biosynthesis/type III secretory pathway M-ring protein FliF/YscJ
MGKRDENIKKITKSISNIETNNPELVEKLRYELLLKKAKKSDPKEIANILRQWLLPK